MRRIKACQKPFFSYIFLLVLLMIIFSNGVLAQKIDLDTLELSPRIEPAIHNVSIIAEINPVAVFQGGWLTVKIFGRIDRGYHLYSVRQQGDFSPNPTKIIIIDPLLTATSGVDESATLLIHDEAFDEPLRVHKNDFWISQRYQLDEQTKPGIYHLTGYLIYQICDNRICSLPLKIHFRDKITVKK